MLQILTYDPVKTRRIVINEYNEKELLKQCQQGEMSAYKNLYERHSTMLYSVAIRMLGTKEDAKDTLQNCFIRLYRSSGQFKYESKFSSYLVKILINCCYDVLSKRKNVYEIRTDEPVDGQNQDWSLTLESAIQMLPLKMRECFILFAVEGFKQQEIAEMMEISEGAVKAHVFQAKKKLRQILR